MLVVFYIFSFLWVTASSEGKRSLSIVYDSTGSMTNDWQYVKRSIVEIVNTHLNCPLQTIRDVIVVPFNDPHVGPVIQTLNTTMLFENLESVIPKGGGDCPEMALTGMQYAMRRGSSHSLIYVYSDASAKDYSKLNEIKQLILKKKSEVIIVLTGKCSSESDPGFNVYKEIAKHSGGALYVISHADFENFMSQMKLRIACAATNIMQADTYHSGLSSYKFLIDSSLKEVTLHVTIPKFNSKLNTTVKDPLNNTVTEGNGLKRVLKSSSSSFVAMLLNPMSGEWSLDVSTKSEQHSVRIYGTSNITFYMRFSYFKGQDYEKASTWPILGLGNFITIKIDGNYTINRIHVLNGSGSQIANVKAIKKSSTENIFISEDAVVFVDKTVHFIKISGYDEKMTPFERLSKTYFIPDDMIATAECAFVVNIVSGHEVEQIKCSIVSPIKVKIEQSNPHNSSLTNVTYIEPPSGNVTFFMVNKDNPKDAEIIPLNSSLAKQSSTYSYGKLNFISSMAIKGDCSVKMNFEPQYSKTNFQYRPIWWINMEDIYLVEKFSVRIVNRFMWLSYPIQQRRNISFSVSDDADRILEEDGNSCFKIDVPIVSDSLSLPCGKQGRIFSIAYEAKTSLEICNLKLYGRRV